MVTDPIGDLLTRIRNSQRIGRRTVTVLGSKMVVWVLDVLKREGFIEGYKQKTSDKKPGVNYEVVLRYNNGGEPMIAEARRVSTPGCRVYSRAEELDKIRRGLGIAVISTSQGVISDREARKRKLGGEVLAYIG